MPNVYSKLIKPVLFRLDPERAHDLGINMLRGALSTKVAQGMASRRYCVKGFGEMKRFGVQFENPLGIAAGFDKNGLVVNELASIGFGFVEVGTVTYEAQPGNMKPRLFRLTSDRALLNRLGFNNDGARLVVNRLRKSHPKCVLGINIGRNKDVPNDEAIENYLKSFDLVFGVADYVAINVSSPNTPKLRDLQGAENLETLLGALQKRNLELAEETKSLPKPLLVKIAPDLSEYEIDAVADVARGLKLAGIIATNTTISRESLKVSNEIIAELGDGGISGKPLRTRSNDVIRRLYKRTDGKLTIIGVGGIFDGYDAYEKIVSGASLVQAYTGFVYGGITFARDVNQTLLEMLKKRGFNSLDEAIGSNVYG